MKSTSLCGKLVTDSVIDLDEHQVSCPECVAIKLKNSKVEAAKSHEFVQVLFTAVTAGGAPLEKREYFWEMHQLGQMVRVADSMANENENVVRLVIDIALPQ